MSEKPVIEVPVGPTVDAKKANARWWTIDTAKDDVHSHLFQVVEKIEERQNYRQLQNLRHARLYSNLELLGLQAGLFSRPVNDFQLDNRMTFNVVKSCVDTSAAKIAKMKPRPMFLTVDGEDDMQRQAKGLTLFMDAAFDKGHVYPNMQRGFVDGGVFGTGATKFYPDGKKVVSERTLIDELLVDDTEGMYGSPLTLYQSKFMSRDVLSELFPKHREKIAQSSSGLKAQWAQTDFNWVRVIEAWRLPSTPGGKDGKHVLCIPNCDLEVGPWKKDYFPFVFQRWNWKLMGFWGCGLAEELLGIQLELNKLLRTVQEAMGLMCVPRVWVEEGSGVAGITNKIAGVGKYKAGTNPPQVSTWPAMPPEVYQHIQNLVNKAYEITGISMLSAQSKKPAGLDSGAALREFQDVESERFQLVGQRYEEAHMEAARIMADMYADLAKANGGEIEMDAVDGKYARKVKWSEVAPALKGTVLRVFPTSLLPSTPAGKLQKVQEMMQGGLIDKETGLMLLDFPDVEGAMSLRLAAIENAKLCVSRILDEGKSVVPEPYMNLEVAKEISQSALLRAQINNVPEKKLELLRAFVSNCDAMIKVKATAGAAPGGAQPALPAVPAPAPTSDLLPIPAGAGPAQPVPA
jgi:hypothetical protein